MRRSGIALMLGAVLMLALAPAAVATTTKEPVAAHEELASVIDPGIQGMTGTVAWARDMIWVADVTGDPYLAGTDRIAINYDLDLVTGSGTLWGKNRFDPTAYPGGHFDCSWSATFVDFVWAGHVVCHGDGSLDGRQLRLEIVAAPGGTADDLSGYTFVPADRL
jgi:hypothetical protein